MARLASLLGLVYAVPISSATQPATSTSYWPGWEGISNLIVFGDSYTTTGFNDTLTQPNATNPLGNPAFPGYTSSNGPNWVDYLTLSFNDTLIETVNLAVGGATVDNHLVAPYIPGIPSFTDQVNKFYLPVYASHPSFFDWQANSTLFASFFGINDIGNSYANRNASTVLAADTARYAHLLDKLYRSGARNFLVLNVPPVNRSPLTTAQGRAAQHHEAAFIKEYNANLTRIAANLSSTYPDATTFVFDTNAIFDQVLDDPCSHAVTCAYRNTTNYCMAYENGTATRNTFDPQCGIPVDEYFWLNTLHPTYRMHKAFARAIAKMLR